MIVNSNVNVKTSVLSKDVKTMDSSFLDCKYI